MKNLIYSILISLIIWPNSLHAGSNSLFALKSVWKDQDNTGYKLEDSKGDMVIIGMVYTSCPHACPMTISKIQEIEKGIKPGVKYKVVLASFDVKNDRPERLKQQMQKRKLDPKVWKMLAAETDNQARELALVLGISYKEIADGEFSHSNAISLLNERGEIVSQLEGLNSDPDEFIGKMNATLKAP